MKMNPVFTIMLLLCSLFTGCAKLPSKKPSKAFEGFNMSHIFAESGFVPEGLKSSGFTSGYSGVAKYLQWGSFSAPGSDFPYYEVFQLVKKHFDTTCEHADYQEGWNPSTEEHRTKPIHIVVFYVQNRRSGELRLWLFPSKDKTNIGFALHLSEKLLS